MTKAPELQRRAERPPVEDVLRMAPFAHRADDDGELNDGLTLDGYAAVFNRPTVINSWEGRFKEKLSPGSMKRSFRETPPRIQFDHGHHPLLGSIPIASVRSISEDTDPELAPEGGAHIVARLHDNWLVAPVRDAIASGSIDGMSFRFSVVRELWYDADGKQIRNEDDLMEQLMRTWYEDVPDDELLLRDLREVKVPELGPVVWPAYDDTSVGVRSVTIDLGRLDDPEQRSRLAQAVLLADTAQRADTTDVSDDSQQAAEGDEPPPAGERQESEHDSQQAAEDSSSAGERQSPSAESRRRRDRIRASAQHYRSYVLGLNEGDA